MTRAMLDIETLATTPDAAIVSVGAVTFSADADPIDEEFHVSVPTESCREHGRRVDQDTVDWWRRQPEEAQRILEGGRSLGAALAELARFLRNAGEVWAKNPAFDCVILESAYRALDCAVEPPWEFWECRDVRTLEKCSPVWPDREHEGVEHNALDDARHQSRCVADCLRRQQAIADGGERDVCIECGKPLAGEKSRCYSCPAPSDGGESDD